MQKPERMCVEKSVKKCANYPTQAIKQYERSIVSVLFSDSALSKKGLMESFASNVTPATPGTPFLLIQLLFSLIWTQSATWLAGFPPPVWALKTCLSLCHSAKSSSSLMCQCTFVPVFRTPWRSTSRQTLERHGPRSSSTPRSVGVFLEKSQTWWLQSQMNKKPSAQRLISWDQVETVSRSHSSRTGHLPRTLRALRFFKTG